jgi:hypothetical protein
MARECEKWVRVRPTSWYGRNKGWVWQRWCTDDYGRLQAAVRRTAKGFAVDLHNTQGSLIGVARTRTEAAAKRAADEALGLH